MLTRIKIAANEGSIQNELAKNGGTIQNRLVHQFPIQSVDLENVRSDGMYKMFNEDRHEIKR